MSRDVSTVFVDRDGVIVRNRSDYVTRCSEVEFIPGALEAVRRLTRLGHRVFVVTNQSAVGRGLVSMQDVDRIHRQIQATVRKSGGQIEAFLTCPHRPSDDCRCRKPEPGLLLAARDRFAVDLGSSFVVGDHVTDVVAAAAAGCLSILVLCGRTSREAAGKEADYIADDLLGATDLIVGMAQEAAWARAA